MIGGKRRREGKLLVLPDGAGSLSKVRRCRMSEPVLEAP